MSSSTSAGRTRPARTCSSALLRQVSEPDALHVVVVEDIHWADEATIDLLRFLGRRIRDATVLLIVTYRDDGLSAGDPLQLALGDLATQRSVRRVGLGPLSVGAVQVMAGGSDREAAALCQLTGGKPVLPEPGDRGRDGRDPGVGPGRGPGPGRAAGPRRRVRCWTRPRWSAPGWSSRCWSRSPTARHPPWTSSSPPGCSPGTVTGLKFRHEIARLAVQEAIPAHRRGLIHARILDALRRVRR